MLETSSSISDTMNLVTMSSVLMMMIMCHLVNSVIHLPLTEHDVDVIKNDVTGDDLINIDSDNDFCVLTTRNMGNNISGLFHLNLC